MENLREDFPILGRKIRDKDLIYFDNAATTQKTHSVINSVSRYYQELNSNVHRGVHYLSQEASEQYESVRKKVCTLLNIADEKEILFTKGTTESLNIVAQCLGADLLNAGDTVIVTQMEHHSNFVPWQWQAKRKNSNFLVAPLNSNFEVDLDKFAELMKRKPKLVSFAHMSNVLGTINPVQQMAEMAKAVGAVVVLDAAQSVAHLPIDIKKLGPIDFLAFSSHKLFGPTGVGVLWGRKELLENMIPWQFGGDMISSVSNSESSWNDLPWKFEAGTPNIAGVIGMGVAIDYVLKFGLDRIEKRERQLGELCYERMNAVEGLKIIGPKWDPKKRGTVFSFSVDGLHSADLAQYLDLEGIATRSGHHCAEPLLRSLGVSALNRASLSFYNLESEIEIFVKVINDARKYFI